MRYILRTISISLTEENIPAPTVGIHTEGEYTLPEIAFFSGCQLQTVVAETQPLFITARPTSLPMPPQQLDWLPTQCKMSLHLNKDRS